MILRDKNNDGKADGNHARCDHRNQSRGSAKRIYASGLRNPVGMAFNPTMGKLWAAVQGRDRPGDNLVPGYLAEVQDGGFYGWPFSYIGKNPDPRRR